MDALAYEEVARLLEYPGDDYPARVERSLVLLRASCPAAAEELERLCRGVGDLTPEQLQEHFTAAFDFDPTCCLEVGWHLFGQDYERGQFLASMREELRKHRIPEQGELPDHLRCLLPLLSRQAPEEAASLAQSALMPVLARICAGLAKKASPFESLLRATARLVEAAQGGRPAGANDPGCAAEGGSP